MVRHFITLVKQEAEAVASFVPRLERATAWKKRDGQRGACSGERRRRTTSRIYRCRKLSSSGGIRYKALAQHTCRSLCADGRLPAALE